MMARLHLPYGRGTLPLDAPDGAVVLEPHALPALADPAAAVRAALAHPIDSAPLRELARGARTATIVVNDITRPCPSQLLVEALLAELAAAGLADRDVTLLVATGNHRPNTPAELDAMLGAEICRRLRVVNHDGRDPAVLVTVGVTPRGVPVEVNRLVVEADLTLLTGNIAPHQTAGFSGGRKSIMPGVASERSLRTHHSAPIRSLLPVMGQIAANAFHEEAMAAARMVGVDFIVNSVKNSRGELVAVVAGDLEAAHAAGVAQCEAAWRVTVERPFDVAVVSAGGYPKDIDLHQSQKAVASAELVTRPGAPIVLVAECPDGMGRFAAALLRAASPQAVIDEFLAEGFRGDEHTSKAYMFARALREHPIVVVSDRLDAATLRRMFLDWAPTPDAGLARALAIAGTEARVAVAPHAVDCIFSPVPAARPAGD